MKTILFHPERDADAIPQAAAILRRGGLLRRLVLRQRLRQHLFVVAAVYLRQVEFLPQVGTPRHGALIAFPGAPVRHVAVVAAEQHLRHPEPAAGYDV